MAKELLAKTKCCDACDAIINNDSYKILKGKLSNAGGNEEPYEAVVCKKCMDDIERLRKIIMESVEPNENGDYEFGSITVRNQNFEFG